MGIKEFIAARPLRTKDTVRTPAAELTLRQSIYPIVLVTILFFLWGFSYGLIDTLNKHFQDVLDITRARSAGLQAAYFGAYPFASIGHAAWLLRHWGYKAVFIWGLFLFGLGAIVAIPCIIARSFGGFCAAIFIIGNGLGSLETAANPYIAVCGPPRFSEIRINISQAFNGVGTVVAPLMGSYVFFNFDDDKKALENVQWVYMAIAIFVWFLAFIFWLSPLPEITDADMAYQAEETPAAYRCDDKPFIKQYRLFHAAFAQFCYAGSQAAVASFFINYATETRPNTTNAMGSQLFAGAQALFTIARFAGVLLMYYFKPRKVFLAFVIGATAFLIPAIRHTGTTGIALLYVVIMFESVGFPTIVALGMRGLGRHSKRGSGYIIAGVSGGAVIPPLLGLAADRHHDMGLAMIVPLCFFLATLTYPLAVNFVPRYKLVIDAFHETDVGVRDTDNNDTEKGSLPVDDIRVEKAMPSVEEARPTST